MDYAFLVRGNNMSTERFFQVSKEQSIIKAEIVSKYFWAWAKVMLSNLKKYGGDRIAYIDLFAGPGRYGDDTVSTPLMILETAINDPEMCEHLVTLFNDGDSEHSQALEAAITSLPGIESLKYPPRVYNQEIGTQIVDMFEQMELVPTLFFVDPWGYKGLSLRLINSVLKNWGCDCVFFFNYNRINMGLQNELVCEHMNALFGPKRADELRERLADMPPLERELTIVEEIAQALKAMGGTFVLPFRFRNEQGTRTSHHLVFVSKEFLGYEIMKGIMAGVSSSTEQGVPSFEFSPASERQPLLFEYSRPMDDLLTMLPVEFAGQRLRMEDIYKKHSVDRPFLKSHYKEALSQLETEGKIIADPPAENRPKRKGKVTFADRVRVTFPG
jgi:three-Cys-motif partner protein